MTSVSDYGLETKFQTFEAGASLVGEAEISGYASVFGLIDQGGDIVRKGAYARSLKAIGARGRSVKMLWQHDPTRPIGVWDEVREDERGLFVRGRILGEVQQGGEALALLRAGAVDGLSIGYRTVRASNGAKGRVLEELELWEVSLVTFPMLPEARVRAAAAEADIARALAEAIAEARADLA